VLVHSYKMSGPVPTFKLEGTNNEHIKVEDVLPESPTALSDAYMDDGDLDDPALGFDNINQQLWMSRLPKYLWETLAKMGDPKAIDQALASIPDDQEIDLGIIRVEGDTEKPERVSLRLNNIPYFENIEKEYILKAQTGTAHRGKQPGRLFMFSEKNKDGYKQRANVWDNLDEDGNPTMRSQLFQEVLRDERKKENKGKYKARPRRPIPKIAAIAGTITQEYDTVPVDNPEHRRLEQQRTADTLKEKEVDHTAITTVDSRIMFGSILTAAERQNINKVRFSNARTLRMLTMSSKHKPKGNWQRTAVQPVSKNRYFSICCSNNFANTNIGACGIYAIHLHSQSNGLRKCWKRSR
jgi:hypothetical protein